MNYHRLNQNLVRRPYTSPIIDKTMHESEGLQYAIKLDINMGYYNIKLLPAIQETSMIVTAFGKFRYIRLLMGMCT